MTNDSFINFLRFLYTIFTNFSVIFLLLTETGNQLNCPSPSDFLVSMKERITNPLRFHADGSTYVCRSISITKFLGEAAIMILLFALFTAAFLLPFVEPFAAPQTAQIQTK